MGTEWNGGRRKNPGYGIGMVDCDSLITNIRLAAVAVLSNDAEIMCVIMVL